MLGKPSSRSNINVKFLIYRIAGLRRIESDSVTHSIKMTKIDYVIFDMDGAQAVPCFHSTLFLSHRSDIKSLGLLVDSEIVYTEVTS